ncbi:hypothetical protein IQ22_00536 [Pseudomonas duriflava]|uniref:UPF0149 protein IQ22_00536 n=1 Tax=Pseudomonas duriflava TaxID=459528 RepID=A0A562QKQ5_9PSED|nr:UPF0149 family protein [Pseudomonas duriflava]TWI57321.1 hypothetical protein IQ22_00536 [Pseudomonas duriflava]
MTSTSSAYAAFTLLLSDAAFPVSPAELHGHLMGRICAGSGFDENDWLAAAADLLGETPEDRLKAALTGLLGMVQQEFAGNEITVVLLLPTDDAPLKERLAAMAQWCQGFLSGFGLVSRSGALTTEAQEVLQDMAAIAQVQDTLEDTEEGENDYMEVTEYLRVAPVMLYNEYGKGSAPAPKPSLH